MTQGRWDDIVGNLIRSGKYIVIDFCPAGTTPKEGHAPKIAGVDRVLIAVAVDGVIKKVSIPKRNQYYKYIDLSK